jgi:hypothetical protein
MQELSIFYSGWMSRYLAGNTKKAILPQEPPIQIVFLVLFGKSSPWDKTVYVPFGF